MLAAAAKHLTPVVLELGGKSPVVVDSNIDYKVIFLICSQFLSCLNVYFQNS